ncbi:MAG: mechanosensitive ion channel family protein [Fimbriimonadales bacterium]
MPTNEWTEAGIALGSFFAVALILRWTLHLIANRLPWRKSPWFRAAFKPIRSFLVWTLIMTGIHTASQSLDYVVSRPALSTWLGRGLGIAWIILAALAVVGAINAYFLVRERAMAINPEFRDRSALMRKLTIGVVMVITLMLAMRTGGLDIAPLLAGGAIGGVIIGLALQDSLSNVFAGLLLTMDSNIRVSDMIEFPNGRTATVDNIGWRSSTLRLLDSTVLVIPNNELSKDRFVNLSRPTLVTTVNIECGISYSEDLQRVEDVAVDVATKVQAELEAGDGLETPEVRWKQFADSSVNFRLYMQIPQPKLQFIAESLLLKRLHERFKAESIEIPFPIRTVVMPSAEEPGT